MSEALRSSEGGMLVVFEGPDGVGKTTVARDLVADLRQESHAVVYLAFPGVKEGTLGHLVSRIHHDPPSGGIQRSIHPASLQLLHVAAHIDAIQSDIAPLLDKGTIVVLDRFWWSTWAYGSTAGVDQSALRQMVTLELAYWGAIAPTAVFLVRRDVEDVGISRDTHEELWGCYERLAADAASQHPVFELSNDGPVRAAVAEARAHLSL